MLRRTKYSGQTPARRTSTEFSVTPTFLSIQNSYNITGRQNRSPRILDTCPIGNALTVILPNGRTYLYLFTRVTNK